MELSLFFPSAGFLLGFLVTITCATMLVKSPFRFFLYGSNLWFTSFFLTFLACYGFSKMVYLLSISEETQDLWIFWASPWLEAVLFTGMIFIWLKYIQKRSPFLESHEMWGIGLGLGGAKVLALFCFNISLSYRVYFYPDQFPQTFIDSITTFSWISSFFLPLFKACLNISFSLFFMFIIFYALHQKRILWIILSIVMKASFGYMEIWEENFFSLIYIIVYPILSIAMIWISLQVQRTKSAILMA
jgi:hypothetical protein